MYCTAHYAREGFLLLKGVHFNIQECIDQKHICYSVSTCTPIQIAMWKLSKCANIFWNVLKLYEALYWAVIVSNLLCAYRILTHTDKTPIAPISMKGSGFFSAAELSTNPRRVRSRGSKTEKGQNRESKQSQNRASKTEGSQKPIVKIRSESKADSQSPKTSQKPKMNSRKIQSL